jgi:hypothetical protein
MAVHAGPAAGSAASLRAHHRTWIVETTTMRTEPNAALPYPDRRAANRPTARWPVPAGLLIGFAAALTIPLLLHSRAVPAHGGQPTLQVPAVVAPSAPGDSSVPDASVALRGNHQSNSEAPPTF